MRKRIIHPAPEQVQAAENGGLDLERLAQVEVTSENPDYPIEAALIPHRGPGWRAANPGEQTIRLIFDHPLGLSHVLLKFTEEEQVRTQEFVLGWRPEGEKTFREIVRQQYTFSPAGTNQEIEDYRVDLNAVTALELRINPNISGGDAYASLAEMSLRGSV
jgi:hypothetical protein